MSVSGYVDVWTLSDYCKFEIEVEEKGEGEWEGNASLGADV